MINKTHQIIFCFGFAILAGIALFSPQIVVAQDCEDCRQSRCEPAATCFGCPGCEGGSAITNRSGKPLGTLKGFGALSSFIEALRANPDNPTPALLTFSKFISTVIGVMTIVAFIWFIFTLLSGAIAWLGSGGDKQKLQNAQKQITTGLTGLIIVISAIFLIKIVGTIFGIDILNIQEAIINLQ